MTKKTWMCIALVNVAALGLTACSGESEECETCDAVEPGSEGSGGAPTTGPPPLLTSGPGTGGGGEGGEGGEAPQDPHPDHLWSQRYDKGPTKFDFEIGTDGSGNVVTATGSYVGLAGVDVRKWGPNGNLQWTQKIPDDATMKDLAVSPTGRIAVVGTWQNQIVLPSGTFTGTDIDGYVSVIAPDGQSELDIVLSGGGW